MLKVGTLFSGGLAAVEFALRYEELEHEIVFACERDKFARKQYEYFHGLPSNQFYISVGGNPLDLYKPFIWDLTYYKDVLKVVVPSGKSKKQKEYKDTVSAWKRSFLEVGQRLKFLNGKKKMSCFSNVMDKKHLQNKKYDLDLMVWGSPCQDLSLAGKRKGFDGAKSSLFREGARVLEEMKPKAFIFENVKGLLSSNGGADHKEVVKTFQDMGYLIAMKVMNTKDYGVPQNRERVFIVGFLDADAYHSFSFEDGFELETRLKHYLDESVDEKYYLGNKFIEGSLAHKELHEERGNGFAFEPKSQDDIASCLSTKYGSRQADTFIKLNQVGTFDIKGNDSINAPCPTLTTMGGGNREPKILQKGRGFNRGGEHSICPTITVNSWQENNHLQEDYRIRKLTPKECFKLQGVKDSCIDLVVSDSQAYKIAGNAISVNVMQSLLRSLYKPVSKKDTLF